MSAAFEEFHFHPDYAVEIDPEFPGTGDWSVPFFAFHQDGHVDGVGLSALGSPLVVRVTGSHPGWVGGFAAGGLRGETGVFACPSPIDVCVVVDGLAYLVNVERPNDGASIADDYVLQVVPVEGMERLLLTSFTYVVAIGSGGMAWRSERIAIDGLTIDHASSDGIVCTRSMSMLSGPDETVRLDPETGSVLEGGLSPPWL